MSAPPPDWDSWLGGPPSPMLDLFIALATVTIVIVGLFGSYGAFQ